MLQALAVFGLPGGGGGGKATRSPGGGVDSGDGDDGGGVDSYIATADELITGDRRWSEVRCAQAGKKKKKKWTRGG